MSALILKEGWLSYAKTILWRKICLLRSSLQKVTGVVVAVKTRKFLLIAEKKINAKLVDVSGSSEQQ